MINSMVIFSIIVIIIFYFAFNELLEDVDNNFINDDIFRGYLSAGILWIAFIFTGMLGISRSFISEKDKNCLEGLMLCPTGRNAIYLGKLISNLVIIFLIEIATVIIFALFIGYDFGDKIVMLIPIFILGTLGFVILGALISAISMNTRTREMLMPLLLLPLLIPIIISAVTATGDVMVGASLNDVSDNLTFLGSVDTIFFIVALFTFEFVIEE
jgi:heme exporter protein B